MKTFISCVLLLFLSSISYGQEFMEQLGNSVQRSEGGSGAHVTYTIYLTSTNSKTFYAKDFDEGKIVEVEGKPLYFELIKKIGEEREIVVINLESAAQMELEVSLSKGKYKFEYKFYY